MTPSSSNHFVPQICQQICYKLDNLYRESGLLPDTNSDLIKLIEEFKQLVPSKEKAGRYGNCVDTTLKKFKTTSERYLALRAKKESKSRDEFVRQYRIHHSGDEGLKEAMEDYDNPTHMQKVCRIQAIKYWQL
jgi:hypothetical protein